MLTEKRLLALAFVATTAQAGLPTWKSVTKEIPVKDIEGVIGQWKPEKYIPKYGQLKEVMTPEKYIPKYGEYIPKYGEYITKYGEYIPKYGEYIAKYGEYIPKYGEYIPKYGEYVSKFKGMVPKYGAEVTEALKGGIKVTEGLKVTESLKKPLDGVKWDYFGKLDGLKKVEALNGFGISDWRSKLPTEIDWRLYLPKNFDYVKYLPKDFDWHEHLKPEFPEVPYHIVDWEQLVHYGIDWKALSLDMGKSWIGSWQDILHEKFPEWDFHGMWHLPAGKGMEWFEHIHDFFSTQKMIKADFDWRHYLTKDFDLRQYIQPKYDIAVFLKEDFDWRAALPKGIDWRTHLPLDFDWKHFLMYELAGVFPEKLDWTEIIPKDLPKEFDWEPFMLTVLHYKQWLPQGFAWKSLIPIGEEWVQHFKEYDWHQYVDWIETLPAEFRSHFYVDTLEEKFHEVVGYTHQLPEEVKTFLAQLKGVIDWSEYKGGNLQGGVAKEISPKHLYAMFDTLKMNPSYYEGTSPELRLAYLKELAGGFFH